MGGGLFINVVLTQRRVSEMYSSVFGAAGNVFAKVWIKSGLTKSFDSLKHGIECMVRAVDPNLGPEDPGGLRK